MIRLLEQFDGSGLRDSHYSNLIRSHLCAYGTEYDFCCFYEIFYRRRVGIISVFNGAAAADFLEGAKPTPEMKREISEFIDFRRPYSAEIPSELCLRRGYPGYSRCDRAFFLVPPAESSEGVTTPEPEYVFNTVFGGAGDYGLWLTDTLRRVNKGSSFLFGYESSVLTVRFTLGGRAYITDVATPPEDRGKGYAGKLLGGVSKLLKDRGFNSYLCAAGDTAGYYRSMNYPEAGRDRIFILNEK